MSKTKYLITTTNLVKTLLAIDPQTRNSDSYLYLKVLEHCAIQKGIDLQGLTVSDFLISMNVLGLPCFETVRRTRQKIQKEYPEFKACESVQEARAENEIEFRSYARSEV
jgi:hypothetical protein